MLRMPNNSWNPRRARSQGPELQPVFERQLGDELTFLYEPDVIRESAREGIQPRNELANPIVEEDAVLKHKGHLADQSATKSSIGQNWFRRKKRLDSFLDFALPGDVGEVVLQHGSDESKFLAQSRTNLSFEFVLKPDGCVLS